MSKRDLHAIYDFANIVAASARSTRQRERVASAAGAPVTAVGLTALRLVEHHGPVPLTDLARRLEVDLSTASRHVKALEDAGLVDRTTDANDRRVAHLAVTAKGRTALDRVRDVALNDFAVAMADWSARDRATLAGLLDRLRLALLDESRYEPERTQRTRG